MTIWVGFVLDLLIGDPPKMPHPIRWIGKAISAIEARWNRHNDAPDKKQVMGLFMAMIIIGGTYLVYSTLLLIAFKIHPYLGYAAEAYVVFRMLATKCLADEGIRIYKVLRTGNLAEARKWIGYLVSRDTSQLTEEAVIKATIETISENTIDGVVSPLFFTFLGGPALGMAYKAANTLDSMVGYKNDRYIDFGKASALIDDGLNWIPARLTGVLMVIAAFLLGLDYRRAAHVLIRDRFNHASPNSPFGEAPTAGALRIQLGGRATYFGVTTDKPTFGDAIEAINGHHIKKAVDLMYVTAFLALGSLWTIRWLWNGISWI